MTNYEEIIIKRVEQFDNPFTAMLDLIKNPIECSELAEKEFERQKQEMIKKKIAEMDRANKIQSIKKFRDLSVVDDKFVSARFHKANKTPAIDMALKYVNKIYEKKEIPEFGIYFYGSVGTGKTYATACMSNDLMRKGYSVLATNIQGYLAKIKSEKWDETEKALLEKIKNVDVLILDDFGTEYIKQDNSFSLEKIFNLIDTRYRAKKSIIISSNIELKEIINKYDARIHDRLREMCIPFEVKGESLRESAIDKASKWFD